MKYLIRKLKFWFPTRDLSRKAMRQLLSIPVGPGEIAIDCGANVGEVTGILAEAGGTVHAFEPNPHAFKKLSKRFRKNKQVVCHPKAVFSNHGTMDLYLHEQSHENPVKWSTGSSLLSEKSNVNRDTSVEVELIDLAEFVNSLGQRIKILKMDVEGVEYELLECLIQSGAIHQIDHVFVETHEDQMPELAVKAAEVRNWIAEQELSHINLNWR